MLAADISLKGDITLAASGQGGNVAYVSDFKYYPDTADTSKYLEFHVKSLNNGDHSGTVELKYVGYKTGELVIPETVTTEVVGQAWTFTVVGIGEKAMDQWEEGYTRTTPLTVNCAVAESAFHRSAFDLYYWDLDSSKLFTQYQDSGKKDLYGNIIYNATVSASGASTGGCGGGVAAV